MAVAVGSALVARSPSSDGLSGLFWESGADGWILTHGSLLRDDLESLPRLDHLRRGLTLAPRDLPLGGFRCRLHRAKSAPAAAPLRFAESQGCRLEALWRCPLLHQSFTGPLFSWSFDSPSGYDKSLRSVFLLLRLDRPPPPTTQSAEPCLREASSALRVLLDERRRGRGPLWSLRRADAVEIESAPFGNPGFLGSVSRGVVSNLVGLAGCVILTDATSVPGCEGAPLFVLDPAAPESRRISGLVVSSLSWCRGERVDYTFAADLEVCLRRALEHEAALAPLPAPAALAAFEDDDSIPGKWDRSLVLVKCGGGWGTGVLVDPDTGTVVTCSHVVHHGERGDRIKVQLPGTAGATSDSWARLVYKTQDGLPYDVAVLSLELRGPEPKPGKSSSRALPLADFAPEKGRRVLTMGFSLFGDDDSGCYRRPSCSQGVVSSATESMLQTTCCVQSGTSGGAVVDHETGLMLGLVVSNVLSSASGLYPRFNMAVPSSLLLSALRRYLQTQDVECLRSLTSTDPRVRETWNFCLLPKPRM